MDPAAPIVVDAPQTAPIASIPYWQERTGIAPIKAEYVLWNKLKSGGPTLGLMDDDAAEGGRKDTREESRPVHVIAAAAALSSPAALPISDSTPSTSTSTEAAPAPIAEGTPVDHVAPTEDGAGPPAKKVRLNGAAKKKLAREKADIEWNRKKDAQKAAKAEKAAAKEAGTWVEDETKKGKGQNHSRKFDSQAGVGLRLCSAVAAGKECLRVAEGHCKWSHDLQAHLSARTPDVPLSLPNTDDDLTRVESYRMCPIFASLGECSLGFKCSFGLSHMKEVAEGEGFMGTNWVLIVDAEKVAALAAVKGEGLKEIREKGEMNVITMDRIKVIRGQGVDKEDRHPLSTAYLTSIGESVDQREDGGARNLKGGKGGKGKVRGHSKGGAAAREEDAAEAPAVYFAVDGDDDEVMDVDPPVEAPPADIPPPSTDIDSHPSRSFVPDMAPVRATEKRRLDFRGKLYLAPLTTVGNLPFRRLCGDYGNDISCSEMGLAQEFMNGNASEWSLVRKHPSEKMFGIQVCGSRPQTLVPTAEALVKACDVDFLDVNCGCPIDLVFNKGAGSALLAHASKLGRSLVGMSKVMGEIPLTIKIRTGIAQSSPVAHRLIPRMQGEWGVSAVTLHGRSRQQRYKNLADYTYIAECARVLREAEEEQGLPPMPIFGNGDAYDYRSYYQKMEESGVDGIMIARGALVKPWIFTEIKERRDWDISARERLDMIGTLASYGLEHWGSDTQGLNTTRRFLCEALSFQHRYVPVGLLERPMKLNERPYPYKGRNELETLLASESSEDWVKITSMFLGPPPTEWSFAPKHKANASTTGDADAQG